MESAELNRTPFAASVKAVQDPFATSVKTAMANTEHADAKSP